MKSILVFIVLILLIIIPVNTSVATENDVPVISEDGKYHIQIIMSQWEYYVYQLKENESIETAFREGNYIAKSGTDASVGPFLVNTGIEFEVYSEDVQHGFAIDALDIALATNRPLQGETVGVKVSVSTILPAEPTILESHCHIFCGLGHSDESLKFLVSTDLSNNSVSDTIQLSILFLPLVFTFATLILFNKRK